MATITGEIFIARPVDVVFDFVADERNEPKYNSRLLHSDKVTDGPIGEGTRFAASIQSMGRPLDMVIEVTSYDRPARFASTTTMSSALIDGTLTFEPDLAGTRMRWFWRVSPKGPFKLLTPVVAWMGKRQEQAIWTGLKHYLEQGQPPAPGANDALADGSDMPTIDEAGAGGAREPAASAGAGCEREAMASRLTSEQVWRALAGASFAVVSYITPAGEPRSSGVVYAIVGRRLYVAVAFDSWKARHIAASRRLAVTVPVRRGGLLSLLFPIPPATVSFHGTAIVHPPAPVEARSLPQQLVSLLPAERQASSCVLEILPEDQFLTYGLGVSLMQMRSPSAARARVPVDHPDNSGCSSAGQKDRQDTDRGGIGLVAADHPDNE